MEFEGTTDAPTPVNLTNHTYWNLSGNMSASILDHVLRLNCPSFLPVDDTQIPTGEQRSVDGSAMDFTAATRVGSRINDVDGGGQPGYDHCYVVGPEKVAAADCEGDVEDALKFIADVYCPERRRRMEVFTTHPGVQLYTANFLPIPDAAAGEGKEGQEKPGPHSQHMALCLEAQGFPDAINQDAFDSPVLSPGDKYRHVTVHRFTVDDE